MNFPNDFRNNDKTDPFRYLPTFSYMDKNMFWNLVNEDIEIHTSNIYAPIGANTHMYVVHLDGLYGRFFSIRGNLGPSYNDIIDILTFGSYSNIEIII